MEETNMDIQFLGEETGLQEIDADSFWILDPVDGTYARLSAQCCIYIRN